jgi:hypothetical protein
MFLVTLAGEDQWHTEAFIRQWLVPVEQGAPESTAQQQQQQQQLGWWQGWQQQHDWQQQQSATAEAATSQQEPQQRAPQDRGEKPYSVEHREAILIARERKCAELERRLIERERLVAAREQRSVRLQARGEVELEVGRRSGEHPLLHQDGMVALDRMTRCLSVD